MLRQRGSLGRHASTGRVAPSTRDARQPTHAREMPGTGEERRHQCLPGLYWCVRLRWRTEQASRRVARCLHAAAVSACVSSGLRKAGVDAVRGERSGSFSSGPSCFDVPGERPRLAIDKRGRYCWRGDHWSRAFRMNRACTVATRRESGSSHGVRGLGPRRRTFPGAVAARAQGARVSSAGPDPRRFWLGQGLSVRGKVRRLPWRDVRG